MTRTPTPWAAHHGWELDEKPLAGHPDWCEITGGRFADGNHISLNGHIGFDNAVFIVLAVNSHDALVAALRDAEDILAIVSDGNGPGSPTRLALDKVRAALASIQP